MFFLPCFAFLGGHSAFFSIHIGLIFICCSFHFVLFTNLDLDFLHLCSDYRRKYVVE